MPCPARIRKQNTRPVSQQQRFVPVMLMRNIAVCVKTRVPIRHGGEKPERLLPLDVLDFLESLAPNANPGTCDTKVGAKNHEAQIASHNWLHQSARRYGVNIDRVSVYEHQRFFSLAWSREQSCPRPGPLPLEARLAP